MKIKEFISYIFAEKENFSLENRLFLSSIIIGFLTSIVGSIMNFVLATSLTASIIPLILTTALGFLYYFVRFKKIMNPLILPIIIFAMHGVSIIWIFNGGIDGSNNITMIVILILALIVVPDKNKFYVLSLHLVLLSAVYFLQLLRPDLIIGFVSEQERWIDSFITIIYCSVFIYLIIKFLHKNYLLEKNRAEESEKRYRALVETANEGILVAQDTTLKYVNPMVSLITGFTEEELLSIPFIEFVHPDDRELMISNYIKRIKGEVLESKYHIRILTKNRGSIWIEMSGVRIDWKGQPATLNLIYDINERKLAEKEILEKNSQLQMLIDNLPANIYFKNENLKYQFINESYANVLNFNKDEIIGKADSELKLPDIFEKIDIELITTKKENSYFEFKGSDSEGNEVWTSSTKVLYNDEFGNVGIIGIVQDISERKKAEIALQESELQFKSLFENAADAIFIADTNTGIILDANQAACNLLKMKKDEIIGIHQSQLHPSEIEDFVKNTFNGLKDTIMISNSAKVVESYVICSDKSIVPVEILASSVHYKGTDAIMGTFRNVTDRKKAEQEIQHKNQELTILNSTKDKFFSIIAHDLKNPIGNFKNITQMMHEEYQDFTENERINFLRMMKESSENIYELLENLLEWSRSQRGNIKIDIQEFDLSYLLSSLTQLLKLSADNKKINIINNIVVNTIINADVNLINTVIRNLISNAIKFTPEGGTVEIGAIKKPSEGLEPSEGSIHIYVKDTGVGMNEETINKLFRIDVNITSEGTNKEKGTGLGLILCKEFVEKHGGKIWVESEVGGGSTFWFSLPK